MVGSSRKEIGKFAILAGLRDLCRGGNTWSALAQAKSAHRRQYSPRRRRRISTLNQRGQNRSQRDRSFRLPLFLSPLQGQGSGSIEIERLHDTRGEMVYQPL